MDEGERGLNFTEPRCKWKSKTHLNFFVSQSTLVPCSGFWVRAEGRPQRLETPSESTSQRPALPPNLTDAHAHARTHSPLLCPFFSSSFHLPPILIALSVQFFEDCSWTPKSAKSHPRGNSLKHCRYLQTPKEQKRKQGHSVGTSLFPDGRNPPHGDRVIHPRPHCQTRKLSYFLHLLSISRAPLWEPSVSNQHGLLHGPHAIQPSHVGAGTSAPAPGTPTPSSPCLSSPHAHQPALEVVQCQPCKKNLPTAPQPHHQQQGSCCILSAPYAGCCAKHIVDVLTFKITCFPFYWWENRVLKRIVNFLADINNNSQK